MIAISPSGSVMRAELIALRISTMRNKVRRTTKVPERDAMKPLSGEPDLLPPTNPAIICPIVGIHPSRNSKTIVRSVPERVSYNLFWPFLSVPSTASAAPLILAPLTLKAPLERLFKCIPLADSISTQFIGIPIYKDDVRFLSDRVVPALCVRNSGTSTPLYMMSKCGQTSPCAKHTFTAHIQKEDADTPPLFSQSPLFERGIKYKRRQSQWK